jgi:hypothetical protein
LENSLFYPVSYLLGVFVFHDMSLCTMWIASSNLLLP